MSVRKDINPGDRVTLDFSLLNGARQNTLHSSGKLEGENEVDNCEIGYYVISHRDAQGNRVLLHPNGVRYLTRVPDRAMRPVRRGRS